MHCVLLQHANLHAASFVASTESSTAPTTSLAGKARIEQFAGDAGAGEGDGDCDGDGDGDGETTIGEQDEAPGPLVVLAGHGMQAIAPVWSPKKPGAHCWHVLADVAPNAREKVPSGH
jgi:hypothetical protein